MILLKVSEFNSLLSELILFLSRYNLLDLFSYTGSKKYLRKNLVW